MVAVLQANSHVVHGSTRCPHIVPSAQKNKMYSVPTCLQYAVALPQQKVLLFRVVIEVSHAAVHDVLGYRLLAQTLQQMVSLARTILALLHDNLANDLDALLSVDVL